MAEGVTSAAHVPEKMALEPAPQECCALLVLGRGWGLGTGCTPSEQSRQPQGMCGSDRCCSWSQGLKAKSGQAVKSIRAGSVLGTFILFFTLHLQNTF